MAGFSIENGLQSELEIELLESLFHVISNISKDSYQEVLKKARLLFKFGQQKNLVFDFSVSLYCFTYRSICTQWLLVQSLQWTNPLLYGKSKNL